MSDRCDHYWHDGDTDCDCGACDVIYPGSAGYSWCNRFASKCRVCGETWTKELVEGET